MLLNCLLHSGSKCCWIVFCTVGRNAVVLYVALWVKMLLNCLLHCRSKCCWIVFCTVGQNADELPFSSWVKMLLTCVLHCWLKCCCIVFCMSLFYSNPPFAAFYQFISLRFLFVRFFVYVFRLFLFFFCFCLFVQLFFCSLFVARSKHILIMSSWIVNFTLSLSPYVDLKFVPIG